MESVSQIIVGEVEAGRSAEVRRRINKLIKATLLNTLDLAELLYESKTEKYFTGWGYETFSRYAKSLDIKYSKAYYLVKIIKNMKGAGLTREEYEPAGTSKLRELNRLSLDGEYKGTPMPLVIRELVLEAPKMSLEEIKLRVDEILGLTAENSMVFITISVPKSAKDNVIIPALELAKKHIPQKQDDEGNHIDATDGAALEMICANFLADPNFAEGAGDTEETSEVGPEQGPVEVQELPE
jgi:hypothetical protein